MVSKVFEPSKFYCTYILSLGTRIKLASDFPKIATNNNVYVPRQRYKFETQLMIGFGSCIIPTSGMIKLLRRLIIIILLTENATLVQSGCMFDFLFRNLAFNRSSLPSDLLQSVRRALFKLKKKKKKTAPRIIP